MKASPFIATHPVFTYQEFADFLAARDSCNPGTRRNLLAHYVRTGRIVSVKRGVYATVPPDTDPESLQVDPYLLASRLFADAVLAYHTALEFHGKAYSTYNEFTLLTRSTRKRVIYRGGTFRGVAFPKALTEKNQEGNGVETADRSGLEVRVTRLERTMVDVMDRPDLAGGWEEIWRSLESVEYFDLEQLVDYALLLGNSTTIARVGFYLDQHQDVLMVDDTYLRRLETHVPRKPHYMVRRTRQSGRLVMPWNLVVPVEIIGRSWGEVQ